MAKVMMVLGDRACGVGFGHEGRALMEEISAIVKEAPESSLAPSTVWGYSEKSAARREGPCATMLAPWPPELREKISVISYLVSGILFR